MCRYGDCLNSYNLHIKSNYTPNNIIVSSLAFVWFAKVL